MTTPGVPFNDLLLAGEPGAGATVVAGVLVPLALVRLAVLRRDL